MTNYKLTYMSGQEHLTKKSMWSGGKADMSHMISEIIDNAIDEVSEGFADTIWFNYKEEESIFDIIDNGRGLPIHNIVITNEKGTEEVESVVANFTRPDLFISGKHTSDNYKFSKGTNGVGTKLVNAHCEFLVCEIKTGPMTTRRYFFIDFNKEVNVFDHKYDNHVVFSTKISFKLKRSLFKSNSFGLNTILNRFVLVREFFPKSKIVINGELMKKELTMDNMLRNSLILKSDSIIYKITNKVKNDDFTIFICFEESPDQFGKGAVNLDFCSGEYIEDFKNHVFNQIKKVYDCSGLQKKDVMAGFKWFINVFGEKPIYIGQTKKDIENRYDYNVFNNDITKIIKKSPELKNTIENLKLAQTNTKLLQKDKTRKKRYDNKLMIPCKNVPGEILYVVEGDSAAGNLVSARDSKKEAILKISGKIPNILNKSLERVLDSQKISAILHELNFSLEKFLNEQDQDFKFKEVRILADADEDGKHIVFLLSMLFIKFFPCLVRDGKVNIILPPLYGTYHKKQFIAIYDEADRAKYENVVRYKGLAEMQADQLSVVIENPFMLKLTPDFTIDISKKLYEDIEMKRQICYSGKYSVSILMDLIKKS
jgi:DNA gyrase/topoisomerase IV subunit B